jgi:signal transduction histidine kinase
MCYVVFEREKILQQLKISSQNKQNLFEKNVAKTIKNTSQRIKEDALIKSYFNYNLIDIKLVERKIDVKYLYNLKNNYLINVYIFDVEGNCLNQEIKGNYFYYYKNYNIRKYKTDFENVFQIRDQGNLFYSFIELVDAGNKLNGYIILELRTKKYTPNSLVPVLFYKTANNQTLSIANYFDGKFLSQQGDFDYKGGFPIITSALEKSLKNGYLKDGHLHLGYKNSDSNFTIVSLPFVSFQKAFFVFSIFFLLFTFLLFCFVIFNTVYFKLRQSHTSLTTKIQLFINLAFFIPLLIISFFTYNTFNNTFKEQLRNSFIEKGNIISKNLAETLLKAKNVAYKNINLENTIENIAQYTQTDILVYNSNGRLIATNQKLFLDNEILTTLIDPKAWFLLKEKKLRNIITEDKIFGFRYQTLYTPILLEQSAEILGYLGIPYFEADSAYKARSLQILMIITNLFTAIFIVFLLLSFFASRILTVPLSNLTQSIKNLDFTLNNKPLTYKANDEIGVLVKEYNAMLSKLHESRQKLQETEKQSAWREMAKQVAHEIKNPLTPIKLTLQNWLRRIENNESPNDEVAKNNIYSLLEQIDSLSDIANSFSNFAQMPEPVIKPFNISTLCNNIISLFEAERNLVIESQIPPNLFCLGDENLVNRILINLITNAIEAVPRNVEPRIHFELSLKGEKILITINDNGTGIEPAIQNQIFKPNFSTKTSGSGIGLAIVKQGIDQMKGNIWFETGEMGTTFLIELPFHNQ